MSKSNSSSNHYHHHSIYLHTKTQTLIPLVFCHAMERRKRKNEKVWMVTLQVLRRLACTWVVSEQLVLPWSCLASSLACPSFTFVVPHHHSWCSKSSKLHFQNRIVTLVWQCNKVISTNKPHKKRIRSLWNHNKFLTKDQLTCVKQLNLLKKYSFGGKNIYTFACMKIEWVKHSQIYNTSSKL